MILVNTWLHLGIECLIKKMMSYTLVTWLNLLINLIMLLLTNEINNIFLSFLWNILRTMVKQKQGRKLVKLMLCVLVFFTVFLSAWCIGILFPLTRFKDERKIAKNSTFFYTNIIIEHIFYGIICYLYKIDVTNCIWITNNVLRLHTLLYIFMLLL